MAAVAVGLLPSWARELYGLPRHPRHRLGPGPRGHRGAGRAAGRDVRLQASHWTASTTTVITTTARHRERRGQAAAPVRLDLGQHRQHRGHAVPRPASPGPGPAEPIRPATNQATTSATRQRDQAAGQQPGQRPRPARRRRGRRRPPVPSRHQHRPRLGLRAHRPPLRAAAAHRAAGAARRRPGREQRVRVARRPPARRPPRPARRPSPRPVARARPATPRRAASAATSPRRQVVQLHLPAGPAQGALGGRPRTGPAPARRPRRPGSAGAGPSCSRRSPARRRGGRSGPPGPRPPPARC